MIDACETCLHWPECNGVDADRCPACKEREHNVESDRRL
jgi:hypothetical protein